MQASSLITCKIFVSESIVYLAFKLKCASFLEAHPLRFQQNDVDGTMMLRAAALRRRVDKVN